MPQLSELCHSIAIPYGVLPSACNQTNHFFLPAGTTRLNRKSRVCTFCPSRRQSKQLIPTYRSDISRKAQQWLTLSYNLTSVAFMCTVNRTRLLYAAHVGISFSTCFHMDTKTWPNNTAPIYGSRQLRASALLNNPQALYDYTNRTHNNKCDVIKTDITICVSHVTLTQYITVLKLSRTSSVQSACHVNQFSDIL
jgi:hypothetical protein